MREKKIRLATLEEARDFVTAALNCDFDIDISYNHVVIDAKSILGVLSLDLTRVLTVRTFGENKEFDELLEKLAPEKDEQIA